MRETKKLTTAIFIAVFAFNTSVCFAQSQFSETLSKMENSLFGMDYNTQSDTARLKRIEEVVYGSASSIPVQQRVSKLSKDLSADLIGKEISPKKDTFDVEQESNYEEPIPKEDSNVTYPIVDALERNTFNKEFKGTEIKQRLTNLEQKTFKRTYNDDLNSRVERLKTAIMPNSDLIPKNDSENDMEYYESGDIMSRDDSDTEYNNYSNKNNRTSYNNNPSVLDPYNKSSDITIQLGAIEKKILKKNYPNDSTSTRLVRLESKVFSSTFTEDDDETRLDRIASAYQASKSSSRYDNNKFSQHMATAMQVGAFLLMILAAVL